MYRWTVLTRCLGLLNLHSFYFLTGIQTLAIASTTQRRRDKIPEKSPFSFANSDYSWSGELVKVVERGMPNSSVPADTEVKLALALLVLNSEGEWQPLIHFILPGSIIRPQQTSPHHRPVNKTQVLALQKCIRILQNVLDIVTDGNVWQVMYAEHPFANFRSRTRLEKALVQRQRVREIRGPK